jgi:hypothetical protein
VHSTIVEETMRVATIVTLAAFAMIAANPPHAQAQSTAPSEQKKPPNSLTLALH